jgi:hypothetical protein
MGGTAATGNWRLATAVAMGAMSDEQRAMRVRLEYKKRFRDRGSAAGRRFGTGWGDAVRRKKSGLCVRGHRGGDWGVGFGTSAEKIVAVRRDCGD